MGLGVESVTGAIVVVGSGVGARGVDTGAIDTGGDDTGGVVAGGVGVGTVLVLTRTPGGDKSPGEV